MTELERLAGILSGEFHNAGDCSETTGHYWKYQKRWLAVSRHVQKLLINARLEELEAYAGHYQNAMETACKITNLKKQLEEIGGG